MVIIFHNTDNIETDTETMHASIANNCSNFLNSNEQIPGLINENDSDYQLYKNSELYKKSSPENVKNLNAFIWYYSTNRLNNNSTVQTNGYNKYSSFKEDNPNLDGQIKNLGCQVLSNNATFTELNDNNDLFPGLTSVLSFVNINNINTLTTNDKNDISDVVINYQVIIKFYVGLLLYFPYILQLLDQCH